MFFKPKKPKKYINKIKITNKGIEITAKDLLSENDVKEEFLRANRIINNLNEKR